MFRRMLSVGHGTWLFRFLSFLFLASPSLASVVGCALELFRGVIYVFGLRIASYKLVPMIAVEGCKGLTRSGGFKPLARCVPVPVRVIVAPVKRYGHRAAAPGRPWTALDNIHQTQLGGAELDCLKLNLHH